MEITINKALVERLKSDRSSGQSDISIRQIKELSGYLQNKRAKVIQIQDETFLVFSELPSIEFWIKDFKKIEDLNFLDQAQLEHTDVSKLETSYKRFILDEFIEGKGFRKFKRFTTTLAPIILLNVCIYYFATPSSIQQSFAGLLTAVSVFVAIFSLFTISHEYLQRKRLSLFEGGKLGYYFSVDKHITKTGVYSIIFAILGLVSTGRLNDNESMKLFTNDWNNVAVIAALNVAFIGVFIILRSIVEFYISRPSKFMLGDLKVASFKKFVSDLDK